MACGRIGYRVYFSHAFGCTLRVEGPATVIESSEMNTEVAIERLGIRNFQVRSSQFTNASLMYSIL